MGCDWMKTWKPYLWRLVFTGLGLVTAILFLTLGFARTILILLCCGIGFAIGTQKDKGLHLPERLWFLRDKW